MKTSDITIVFQGAFKPYAPMGSLPFAEILKRTRKAVPGARIMVSTWEGADVPEVLGIDQLVQSKDPGALAPLKLTDTKANNINRQIVCTRAGLAAVTTPYALKLRTDSFLEHAGFIDFYLAQLRRDQHARRIVANAFFTLDTAVFERFPYHVSDWAQFGLTEVLQTYWDVPLMTPAAGRFYENRPHPANANVFERRFRAEFAVEQYIGMHYAGRLGYPLPRCLNDSEDAVLAGYRRFLAEETLVLDPWQLGVVFPKYGWVNDSVLQGINNVMHLDWLAMSGQPPFDDSEPEVYAAVAARRRRLKAVTAWLFNATAPLHGVLFELSGRGRVVRRLAMGAFKLVRRVTGA
jgi:hypothetical protein